MVVGIRSRLWIWIGIAGLSALPMKPSRASDDNPLTPALRLLSEAPRGRALLKRSLEFWKAKSLEELLESSLRPSEVSRTDSVLVRRFDPVKGVEVRDRQVTVFIREDQTPAAIALDLAHELIHATAAPSWDPYDPKLTAGGYVQVSIEGSGGEMEAVVSECEVGLENPKLATEARPRCEGYWSTHRAGVDTEKVKEDFYRVGQWISWVERQLGKERPKFTRLSAKPPRLYSSTGRAPYPVSLIQEYREITAIACENSKKRLAQAKTSLPGRSPASAGASHSTDSQDLIRNRCQNQEHDLRDPQSPQLRAKAD